MPTSCHKPLVSVGIPTYNRPQGLARTLGMIQAQTYAHLEIIISDNHSTEPGVLETALQAVETDSRVAYYRQQENLGAFPNYQFVFSKARGEYFLWAADDDEWDPRFIETCLAAINGTGTVMTGLETHWRASGRRERNAIPVLDPAKPVAENLQAFLDMLTPGLIYGLHRTQSIRRVLTDQSFDFYDCAFIAKQIIGAGVRTLEPTLYAAGVDDAEYCIKYSGTGQTQLLYTPFLRSLLTMIVTAKTLTTSDKIRLVCKAFSAVLGQIRHHEQVARPGLVLLRQLAGQLMQWRCMVCHRPTTPAQNMGCDADIHGKESFAQCGEDLIVEFIFQALRIPCFTYLDIGANHPSRLSNTCRFYRQGMRGVCVEPDPELFAVLAEKRPEDQHVNAGISDVDQEALPFYILSAPTLNTFCQEEAVRLTKSGAHTLRRVTRVPMISIPSLLARYFPDKAPDFLSVDVEGLDLQILRAIDFSRCRPKVICVETLSYSESRQETKETEAKELLEHAGYFLYADTYINSIFVDAAAWKKSA